MRARCRRSAPARCATRAAAPGARLAASRPAGPAACAARAGLWRPAATPAGCRRLAAHGRAHAGRPGARGAAAPGARAQGRAAPEQHRVVEGQQVQVDGRAAALEAQEAKGLARVAVGGRTARRHRHDRPGQRLGRPAAQRAQHEPADRRRLQLQHVHREARRHARLARLPTRSPPAPLPGTC